MDNREGLWKLLFMVVGYCIQQGNSDRYKGPRIYQQVEMTSLCIKEDANI
jgi:hypothetical protein